MASATMEQKPASIKIPENFEITILGNLFALLIALGGLLGGSMLREMSFSFWLQDIVPLTLLVIILMRLVKNAFDIYRVYLYETSLPEDIHPQERAHREKPTGSKETIQKEHAAVGQLPDAYSMDPEKVVEEVVKRIEAQKAGTLKKK